MNDIFDVFQSAYRPAHSYETALVRIQDDILVSLDNRNTVILVLLDLSAAFDTVDHRLLLDKLYRIGIRGNAHRWMHSYLSERTQVVRVDTHTSRCVDLCFGVPHGSVLGPLLFTVYCWARRYLQTSPTNVSYACRRHPAVCRIPPRSASSRNSCY